MVILSTLRRWFGKTQQSDSSKNAMLMERFAKLRASYDAARSSDEFKNYWANADQYDADSANSKTVRHTLISRSRYEIGNNGYADGIATTYATDLVGKGPTLRMQTGSEGFNRMVEQTWFLWSQAVQFRRKLWCMTHAKHSDGETFAVLRINRRVNHPVPLDIQLYEAEQCQTPYLPFSEPGYIDGIKFDEFGNPLWYDILHQHPGTTSGASLDMVPERVAADKVLHWFKMRRPGQHRGVPESSSTLNLGAAARRWREATLTAAERAALMTMMMETQMTPDEADAVAPFSTMDIEKGLMNFLPVGWKASFQDAKFPTATHEAFNRALIGEQARSKGMPYNRAAADSSGHNFASGKLDFLPYFATLDVDREDCNDLVLNRTFGVWFDLCVARFGWLGGNPNAIGEAAKFHIWDWPELTIGDQEVTANANKTSLATGQTTLSRVFSKAGFDFEDELVVMAKDYGVEVDEMREILRTATFNAQNQQASMKQAETQEEVAEKQAGDTTEEADSTESETSSTLASGRRPDIGKLLKKVNGNGAGHG